MEGKAASSESFSEGVSKSVSQKVGVQWDVVRRADRGKGAVGRGQKG
jgi:hypothetical protein